MRDKFRLEDSGYSHGQEVVDQGIERAAQIVYHEKARLQNLNEPKIQQRRIVLAFLCQQAAALQASLPPLRWSTPERCGWWKWVVRIVASVFVVASVAFFHAALGPFNLGPTTWVLSVALGLVVPYAAHHLMEHFQSGRTMVIVALLVVGLGLIGVTLQANVRGEILILEVKRAFVTSELAEMQDANSDTRRFYEGTSEIIKWMLVFMGLSMELASALAFWEVSQSSRGPSEGALVAYAQLAAVIENISRVVEEISTLQNQPNLFEAEFWRNFYIGLVERAKDRAQSRGILPVLTLAMLFGWAPPVSFAQNTARVVVAVDFSQSVRTPGYDGQSAFAKNVDAAVGLVGRLPAGSLVAFLAITDDSFSRPTMLLLQHLPASPGPLRYVDHVLLAKQQLVKDLRRKAQSIPPTFKKTDLLGAIEIAAQLLNQGEGTRALILLSDMRHVTREIDLEAPARVDVSKALNLVTRYQLLANLGGTTVYACGVETAGKSVLYWKSLQEFWRQYFQACGASLGGYSVLRDAPLFTTGP